MCDELASILALSRTRPPPFARLLMRPDPALHALIMHPATSLTTDPPSARIAPPSMRALQFEIEEESSKSRLLSYMCVAPPLIAEEFAMDELLIMALLLPPTRSVPPELEPPALSSSAAPCLRCMLVKRSSAPPRTSNKRV
eukprot:1172761-Prymnesium_polylepis.2